MRSSYSISSLEYNDKIFGYYEDLVYLLGYQAEEGVTHSGLYDRLETSGNSMLSSPSGIPTFKLPRMIDFLKLDYMYRKNYGEIQYMENLNGR